MSTATCTSWGKYTYIKENTCELGQNHSLNLPAQQCARSHWSEKEGSLIILVNVKTKSPSNIGAFMPSNRRVLKPKLKSG